MFLGRRYVSHSTPVAFALLPRHGSGFFVFSEAAQLGADL